MKLIAVTGPTASGKTRLAAGLAEKFNGEIISVDSRQIYKELNIGTAKPSIEERQRIKHHLLDIVSVTDEYTAANFCDDASGLIKDIVSRGKLPILAGGTGLYFRLLLEDYDMPRSAPDKALREKLEQLPAAELHEKLRQLDNKSAEKIHPNNKVKIIRAIEVCINSGMPMSMAQKKKEAEYSVLRLGMESVDKKYLYDIINIRADEMLRKGLLDEAEVLYKKYGENKILLSTIGYQEFIPYFKGETDFQTASELLKQNTRRYAKRQICWFKPNREIHRFDIKAQTFKEIEAQASQMAEQFVLEV